MGKLVKMSVWDKRTFEVPHVSATLSKWAKLGYTEPKAIKAGNAWMVDTDAVYVGPPPLNTNLPDLTGLPEKVVEILTGAPRRKRNFNSY